MFIDISLRHSETVMDSFVEDVAEHYGYLEELRKLDLRQEAQALFAIRTWIVPDSREWSPTGRYQRMEACRFVLMTGRCFGEAWLPGIDGPPEGDAAVLPWSEDRIDAEYYRFQLLVWRELFPEERFEARPLGLYRQRVDFGFYVFPDSPSEWGTPKYLPWPQVQRTSSAAGG